MQPQKTKFVPSYFPTNQDWHVLHGEVDVNGLVTGTLFQNGEEIAVMEEPNTAAEISAAAWRYMEADKKEDE